jgi:hypothetical protein
MASLDTTPLSVIDRRYLLSAFPNSIHCFFMLLFRFDDIPSFFMVQGLLNAINAIFPNST